MTENNGFNEEKVLVQESAQADYDGRIDEEYLVGRFDNFSIEGSRIA